MASAAHGDVVVEMSAHSGAGRGAGAGAVSGGLHTTAAAAAAGHNRTPEFPARRSSSTRGARGGTHDERRRLSDADAAAWHDDAPPRSMSNAAGIDGDARVSFGTSQMEAQDGARGRDTRWGGGETALERGKVTLTLWRLMGEAKPERCTIVTATGALFLSALFTLSVPYFFGRIIDAIARPDEADSSDRLRDSVVGLVVVAIAGSFFTFARRYLFALAGERVVARLHRKLFHAIMQQEVGFFDATRTGELVSRLSSDTSVLKNTVTSNISMGLRWAATVIGGILFLFFISWKLTLVMITIVPVVAIGARYYGTYVRNLSKQTRRALAKATEVAEESISAIRTVRSFAQEPKREIMFGERVDTTLRLGIKSALAGGVFAGGASCAFTLSFVAIIYYGGSLVLDGELSSGVLTSFLLYSLTIAGALAGLAGLFGDFMKSVGATDRVFQILDRVPTVPLLGGRTLEHVEGNVEFESVNFAYPTRPDQRVLAEASFHIEAGRVTALVGPSGGGKSTVVNLIERFYDVDAKAGSRLTLDGVPVCELDSSWLRTRIGLVRQEPQLFCATISENIAFGVKSATMRDIVSAAKRANAHTFIMKFPNQYDTLVGERGVRLSGGQKQRIAIARALLKDPKVLLLDEATSALDAESEHLVQEALDRLMEGRTVLIIAHRLSTVKDAHTVLVLDSGTVKARGRHEELMRTSPLYAKLVKHQLMQHNAQVGALQGSGDSADSTASTGELEADVAVAGEGDPVGDTSPQAPARV